MANWISSKLKVAENILHQANYTIPTMMPSHFATFFEFFVMIDQQAAESLRKNERLGLDEPSAIDVAPAKSGGSVSLKDQLKKKPLENNDYRGKLRSDPNFSKPAPLNAAKPSSKPNPNPALTDGDWTELLSSPTQPTAPGSSQGNGVPSPRSLTKNNRKHKSLSSGLSVSDVKRNPKSVNGASSSLQRLDSVKQVKPSGKVSDDGKESTSSGSSERHSNVESETDNKWMRGQEYTSNKDTVNKVAVETDDKENEQNHHGFSYRSLSQPQSLQANDKVDAETIPEVDKGKIAGDVAQGQLRSAIKERDGPQVVLGHPTSDHLQRGSSMASDDGSSDSDTDSDSTSDSESEREREERRKKRERILAEKAEAKAMNTIKELENMVAKLEGEKQSIEKILEERAKQQAQEASQLQTSMMETMEAAELEKQKHNNTRMETANADLAKSLAAVQWNLEVEIKQVAELRQQIAFKESVHEELKRSTSNLYQAVASQNQMSSKGVEFEREILEAEHSIIGDKVTQLQEKARKLEADIEMTRKEIEEPTEVEVELKRRLQQMTDHLIQKQAKVESLSSEKASLVFRIEAVSRLLDENMSASGAPDMNSASSSGDLESGIWELSNSKLKPILKARIHSGKKQLGSLLQQLDYIFVTGAVFLRRNSTAKLWALVYLVCLHFWVIYILMSHSGSGPSNEARSGAVISLDNINSTGG
ncbi:hypothetical protein Ahy_B03g062395 [Arachis hypogaea]|uniref:Golgin candidate n=1 Tax=Arachis hypogaea TaxID=3818 RepID=A0A444ZTY4_ARAHY|nr:hypothetical protein Ahy_B03g062395 [Arachis hypogaea]